MFDGTFFSKSIFYSHKPVELPNPRSRIETNALHFELPRIREARIPIHNLVRCLSRSALCQDSKIHVCAERGLSLPGGALCVSV